MLLRNLYLVFLSLFLALPNESAAISNERTIEVRVSSDCQITWTFLRERGDIEWQASLTQLKAIVVQAAKELDYAHNEKLAAAIRKYDAGERIGTTDKILSELNVFAVGSIPIYATLVGCGGVAAIDNRPTLTVEDYFYYSQFISDDTLVETWSEGIVSMRRTQVKRVRGMLAAEKTFQEDLNSIEEIEPQRCRESVFTRVISQSTDTAWFNFFRAVVPN